MSVFIKSDQAFSDTSIPVIGNDTVLTTGTRFIADARENIISWAKQAAPILTDTWNNLKSGGVAATFGPALPTWNNGFVFGGVASAKISLPANCVFAAGESLLAILWFKHLTPSGSGAQGQFGVATNTGVGNQYSIYYDASGNLIIPVVNGFETQQGAGQFTPVPNSIYQVAVSAKKRVSDGMYDIGIYRNGQQVVSYISTKTALQVPAASAVIGRTFGGDYQCEIKRVVIDDLTDASFTPLQIVQNDYNDNADWMI